MITEFDNSKSQKTQRHQEREYDDEDYPPVQTVFFLTSNWGVISIFISQSILLISNNIMLLFFLHSKDINCFWIEH